jgi:class 3 adenylate cyclase
MSWNRATARERILKLTTEVPSVQVERFAQYQRRYLADMAVRKSEGQTATPPLFRLPKGRAIVVDTVQIYINIVNYDDYRIDNGRETEASHAQALSLLHLYYSAADRVIEASPAQRVDYHSGRVHAVVIEEGDAGITRETLAKAFAFIEDFQQVADTANRDLAASKLKIAFRVGVDIGTCVAINNGTGDEQEPLFLGSAANHAAKLAGGSDPGIYLSGRVRALLGLQEVGLNSEFIRLSDSDLSRNAARRQADGRLEFGPLGRSGLTEEIVANWRDEIRRGEALDLTEPNFKFFFMQPPLRKLVYAELMPSNTIRMTLVSMFADLSGYTRYVDDAVRTGQIQDAVRALYVIRSEFQNVVEADFNGRKVRFIGDCIHALLAEGTSTVVDDRQSVATSVLCAAGLHGSFELCQEILGNLDSLGLAVGVEIGMTPVSRIGIRGERSVRVASSVATSVSELMQKDCEDAGVKLGPEALRVAPRALEDLIGPSGYAAKLRYADVTSCLSIAPQAMSSPAYVTATASPIAGQPRAHLCIG